MLGLFDSGSSFSILLSLDNRGLAEKLDAVVLDDNLNLPVAAPELADQDFRQLLALLERDEINQGVPGHVTILVSYLHMAGGVTQPSSGAAVAFQGALG